MQVASVAGQWVNKTFLYEARVRRADRRSIAGCCYTTKCPCVMRTGTIVRWYGSSIDIEERQASTAELRSARKTFDQIVEV